jgi:type IV secretory pathway TrbF-like protein
MHLLEHTIRELEAHASDLMQKSPASWDVAYDEAIIVRGSQHSIALWPKFEEYVHAQHMLATSRREVNPLNLEL